MRAALTVMFCLLLVSRLAAQEKKENPASRYDVVGDSEAYPQGSPKEAMTSVAKAIERERFDYLLAHLADPQYVDGTVKKLGKFSDLVATVKAQLNDDAKKQREFLRLLKDGVIEASGSGAKATLKDIPGRQVTLKQIGKRWFLENPDKVE